ncbi:MAG: Regulator of RpoS [Elusimicrobia bacterium]|nr:Regulator of RpoS [Elusimicrobiota bacterium]
MLVVDDDESVLSFLAFSLKNDGFSVLEARDAERGLKLLKTQKPDIILLDIMLPKMDGFKMCKTLRQIPGMVTTPVLFITAYADPTSLDKTQAAGAQGLIEKPIMYSELLVQLLDALEGRFALPTRLRFAA